MNRRDFIQSLALAGLGIIPIGRSAWAMASASANNQRKLIVIMLRGAVDGLSVAVPHGDANYYRLRPTIAIPRPGQDGGALDLDGYFGLHPALAPLQPLWQQGTLAFVHAAGSSDKTRSHFDAQDFMESGTPGRKATADGWMNRLVGVLPGNTTPMRAISIGATMPRILSGRMAATNIAAGPAAAKPSAIDRPMIGDAFAQLYQGGGDMARAYLAAQQSHQEIISSLEDEMQKANNGAPLPNGFPNDASRLAKLMRNDANIQLAFIALGGWDTHANQGASSGQLANHLSPLGQGLATLASELGPMLNDTCIIVMSEFGRTVRQNGNNGTDHGHGNVMWLLGGPVAGKRVYGAWSGLSENNLYEGRDLPVLTDFREVLANVLGRHLGLTDTQLGQVFPALPVSRSTVDLIRV